MAQLNGKSQSNGEIKIKNLLDNIDSEVEPNSLGLVDKGNRFANWVLRYMFERTEDEIDSATEVSGKYDNSVDAWYEENNILHIVQCKYGTAHSWKAIAEFITNIEKLLTEPFKVVGQNDKLYELASRIEAFQLDSKEISLFYVTNSYLTQAEIAKSDFHKEKFEKSYTNTRINIFGIEEIKGYLEMELNSLPAKYRGKEAKLLLKNKFITDTTCVAEVAVKDLAKFVYDNEEYLFYSNVRNFLRNTNVNKGISETFRKKPTDFWFYNNGVTIVCDNFFPNSTGDFILTLNTPQIVNGCQTANTICNEWRKMERESAKNLQGSILVKIIKDPNSIRRDDITRFTNTQNAISGKDFYALDIFQKKLQREFKELGFYYEIQRKSSLALSPSELKKFKGNNTFKYLFPKNYNNVLPVKEVVQAYAAGMHLLPATASTRSGELAPYAEQWSKLFNKNTPEDPYHFLFPYAVMQYAKTYLGYNSKNGKGFRKNCSMLYVTTYFKLIVYLLRKMDKYDKLENVDPLKINIVTLRQLFDNEGVNKVLLALTDKTLEFYMRDNSVKVLYQDNLPKFLKSAVQTNSTALEAMANQIKDSIEYMESIEFEEIQRTIC